MCISYTLYYITNGSETNIIVCSKAIDFNFVCAELRSKVVYV